MGNFEIIEFRNVNFLCITEFSKETRIIGMLFLSTENSQSLKDIKWLERRKSESNQEIFESVRSVKFLVSISAHEISVKTIRLLYNAIS